MIILFGGDVAPTPNNRECFASGDVSSLMGEALLQIWNQADFRFFNLECPITDRSERIIKVGPHLVMSKNQAAGLLALRPTAVMLANNHIRDAGAAAVQETVEFLTKNHVQTAGVGSTPEEASKPLVFSREGQRIGLYACADREFSDVHSETAGANTYDDLTTSADIKSLSAQCDYLIAVYHGGKEYYRYPSPGLQKRCRNMIDCGADLVLCQHSHCVGCQESYNGRIIVYGQGNLLFSAKRDEFWDNSLLIKIELEKEQPPIVECIPLALTARGIDAAGEEAGRAIMEGFRERSEAIREEAIIPRRFDEFSQHSLLPYLYYFAGWNRYLVWIDRKLMKGWMIKRKFTKRRMAGLWDFIACDAHRELLLRGLEQCFRT